mmetsp:Transcript_81335/g.226476  ORF Transcript_81335/g.226476 Transcript_81335/m.226476 type:complete len:209 (+) Transcript_81335:807-1433(+)
MRQRVEHRERLDRKGCGFFKGPVLGNAPDLVRRNVHACRVSAKSHRAHYPIAHPQPLRRGLSQGPDLVGEFAQLAAVGPSRAGPPALFAHRLNDARELEARHEPAPLAADLARGNRTVQAEAREDIREVKADGLDSHADLSKDRLLCCLLAELEGSDVAGARRKDPSSSRPGDAGHFGDCSAPRSPRRGRAAPARGDRGGTEPQGDAT